MGAWLSGSGASGSRAKWGRGLVGAVQLIERNDGAGVVVETDAEPTFQGGAVCSLQARPFPMPLSPYSAFGILRRAVGRCRGGYYAVRLATGAGKSQ